ncbi:MAG: hypothetical protein AB1486_00390 [Planctomycetota bacterium]
MAAFLAAATILFCGRALDPGVIFLAGDVPLASPPFRSLQPADFKIANVFLSDQTTIFYPWLWHAREKIRTGEFPLWSPESYGGVPFFGNLSTALLFPLTWLYLVLPFAMSFVVVAILKLWLAGFCLYVFLRLHHLAVLPALAGAIAYQFAGYNVIWLHYALSHVATLAPGLLVLIELWWRKPTGRRVAFVALGFALTFLAGHPETTTAVTAVAAAYLVCRARSLSRSGVRCAWLAAGAAPLLALGLALVQLWPFAEYLLLSEGRRIREQHIVLPAGTDRVLTPLGAVLFVVGAGAALSAFVLLRRRASLTIGRALLAGLLAALAARVALALGANPSLALVAMPHLYGDPAAPGGYTGPHTFNDVNGAFIGVLPLVLGLAALLTPGRTFLGRFFAVTWLASVAAAYRIPGVYQVVRHLPVLSSVAETRLLVAMALSGAVLAALGAEQLLGSHTPWRARVRLLRDVGLGLLAGGLAFASGRHLPLENLFRAGETSSPIAAPAPGTVHVTRTPLTARLEVPAALDELEVTLDGTTIARHRRPPEVTSGLWTVETPVLVAARADDGAYRLGAFARGAERIELGRRTFTIRRARQLDWGDLVGSAMAVVLLLLLWLSSPFLRGRLGWTLPLAVAVELYGFGAGYNPVIERDRIFPSTRITDFLHEAARREGPHRVLPEGTVLQPNIHYVYGFQHVKGYDCLEPRSHMRFLRFLAKAGEVAWRDWSSHTIRYDSPLFDLLGIRYVVSPEELSGVAGLEHVLAAEGLHVYRNSEACPRAFIVGRAVRVKGGDLEQLAAFDPRRTAFLEVEAPPAGGSGAAELAAYEAHRVAVRVQVQGEALLVLADTHFPGWRVTVDGEPREILRTHGTFRAVRVRAGDELVLFEYRPLSVRCGAVVSLVSALLVVVLMVRRGGRDGARLVASLART